MLKRLMAIVMGFTCFVCVAFADDEENGSQVKDIELVDSEVATMNDSVRVTQLEELVVKSQSRWFEADKLVCIPTKQEKNLSNTPADLIGQLKIPGFRVAGNAVTDAGGNEVQFFINGVEANNIDIAAFRSKDVLRIEYMLNPDDPRFHGARSVVNIIMREYEIGGVTKISGNQTIPNWGLYSVASKLNYKFMTYSLMFSPYYSTSRQSQPNTGREEYRDLYYKGKHYNDITRSYEERTQGKNNTYDLAAIVRYDNKKLAIVHKVALKWLRQPEQSSSYKEIWSSSLFDSYGDNSWNSYRGIVANVVGAYEYRFKDKWNLGALLNYSHNHKKTYAGFLIEENPVINDITETSNAYAWRVMSRFRASRKWVFDFNWSGNFNNLDIYYRGTTSQSSKMRILNTELTLSGYWRPIDSFMLYITPGLSYYISSESGGEATNSVTPDYNIGFNWNINRKLSVVFSHSMQNENPWASDISDAVIQTAPLLWATGNPYLKNYQTMWTRLSVSWLASGIFEMNGAIAHSLMSNWIATEYAPASSDMGGLIMTKSNGGKTNWLEVTTEFKLSLFNSKLQLSAAPSFRHQSSTGVTPNHINCIMVYGDVTYRFGNCSVSAIYSSPEKSIWDSGASVIKKDDRLHLSFTYGNGDFFVSVSASDLFYKFRHISDTYTSGNYRKISDSYYRGRSLGITLSYVFGYGKRIDRDINIDRMSAGRSGIVGSDNSR